MRHAALAMFAMSVMGCASGPAIPVNQPMIAAAPSETADYGLDDDALILALSGGGARAASFSYGALLGLREMPATHGGRLIDRVRLVTSVSGGSITAAYFGQHGPDDLGFQPPHQAEVVEQEVHAQDDKDHGPEVGVVPGPHVRGF